MNNIQPRSSTSSDAAGYKAPTQQFTRPNEVASYGADGFSSSKGPGVGEQLLTCATLFVLGSLAYQAAPLYGLAALVGGIFYLVGANA